MDKIQKEINEYEVNNHNLREIWISYRIKIIHLDKKLFCLYFKIETNYFLVFAFFIF